MAQPSNLADGSDGRRPTHRSTPGGSFEQRRNVGRSALDYCSLPVIARVWTSEQEKSVVPASSRVWHGIDDPVENEKCRSRIPLRSDRDSGFLAEDAKVWRVGRSLRRTGNCH